MHIGVLAAIGRKTRPILAKLFGAGAGPGLPKALINDLANIGEQRNRVGMAGAFCARRRQHHKAVAIGELVALARPGGVEGPEIAAMFCVAMMLTQRLHAMVDNVCGAGSPHEMSDGEAMHHARRHMQRALGVAGQGLANIVEIEKPAGDINEAPFIKAEQRLRLAPQPAPMLWIVAPAISGNCKIGHARRSPIISHARRKIPRRCQTSTRR